MISIARLQEYLRQNARKQYEWVALPLFSLFFHRTDPFYYFNYAIPDEPVSETSPMTFSMLREEFARRGRLPRFEFLEEFAPRLGELLCAYQFVEEARQVGMVCTPSQVRFALPLPGLDILHLVRTSPISEAKTFIAIQRQGFHDQTGTAVSDQHARQFLADLHEGRGFLARWEGQPVGVGMYTTPMDGLTEIVGVATLPVFRRHGIGAAIIGEALRAAFAQGVEAVYLTAENEHAGQLYARAGFRAYATMLAYRDRNDEQRGS
jgi:ribosomal protein S18 acetylase RimI-like enzyme